MPKSTQRPAAPNGGVYPKFIQSPKALVGQQYGRSGLQYFMPGWIRRDFLPELQGRNLWLVYEQMGSNDAYVGSALNAYSLFIRRTSWHVDPVVDENEENGSAKFLEQCMNDMQHSWQTFIATAAKPTLQFGFSPFEKIFKERNGEQDDDRYSSEYDDNAIGWANFSFRSPDTVFHWDYDPEDVTRLIGLTQLAAPDYHTTFIPIEKILNLRAEPGKDSPEGRSILRPVWRSWRTKTIMEDLRNVTAERGGAGIPWAEVPANIANAPATGGDDPDALASYNSLVETLTNITTDAQKWIITPQVWDANGQPMIKIGFLQPSQNADIISHITQSIEAEAKAILIATMTEFQALGMGGTGSLALSRDKTDNFTLAVAATATAFQESINSQAVKQLFRLNPQFEFERGKPRPKIVYDPLVPLSTQDIVAILGLFEKAGWDLSQQGGIRDAIIKNLGLPDYIEQETNDALHEHGDSPIESLLDGKSAIDAILSGVQKSHTTHYNHKGRRQIVFSKVRDASGHEHDDLGRFTGPGNSGSGKRDDKHNISTTESDHMDRKPKAESNALSDDIVQARWENSEFNIGGDIPTKDDPAEIDSYPYWYGDEEQTSEEAPAITYFHNGVQIYAPADPDLRDMNRIGDDAIEQAINSVPPKLRKYIEAIQINPYAEEDMSARAQAEGSTIILFGDQDKYDAEETEEELPYIFNHEAAHLFDQGNKRISATEEYKNAIAADGNHVTSYSESTMRLDGINGRNGKAEDFAEAVAIYHQDKEAFSKKHPNRARVLDAILGGHP